MPCLAFVILIKKPSRKIYLFPRKKKIGHKKFGTPNTPNKKWSKKCWSSFQFSFFKSREDLIFISDFLFQLKIVIQNIEKFLFHIVLYWTLDVSWTASYEITLVRPSVCPTVYKFSQEQIISFLWYCTWW